MTDITNSDDIIDSRDVIARIEELQDEHQDLCDAIEAAETDAERFEAVQASEAWDGHGELTILEALASECGDCGVWKYGETLIRDSYFKHYAMDLADDLGAIDANASWPSNCIDWDRAVRELQVDYMKVDFGGVTYWIRA